jgi:hypothetical protein
VILKHAARPKAQLDPPIAQFLYRLGRMPDALAHVGRLFRAESDHHVDWPLGNHAECFTPLLAGIEGRIDNEFRFRQRERLNAIDREGGDVLIGLHLAQAVQCPDNVTSR